MATAKKQTASKKATAKKATPKRGRPPKPEGELRRAQLNVRLHPDERAELEAGAAKMGETLTVFLLTAARERLAKVSRR